MNESPQKRRKINSQLPGKNPKTVINSNTNNTRKPSSIPIQTTPESSEDDDDEPGIRTDIIDFISAKKEFVLSLVSDDWDSECKLRSERVMAIRKFSSFQNIRK